MNWLYRKRILWVMYLVLFLLIDNVHALNDHSKALVEKFIENIKRGDKEAISKLVLYPFPRPYPIASIKNSKEFVQRYNEVFDEILIEGIIKANINTDWSNAGAGITLRYGTIWMDDSDGRLFGINYQTDIGKKKRNELIERDRKRLHSSLQDYLEPVLEWKTQKYRIRIDILKNYKYRYSVWTLPLTVKEKPDLVLGDGNIDRKGTMGNYYFDFRNGSFLYGCYLPANEWEKGYLEVFRNEEWTTT